MSEEQLRKLISEGLKEGVSAQDQEIDTDEFEDSEGLGGGYDEVPMSDVDMPIQDKGVFSAMAAGENEEDFSDVASNYGAPEDSYEGGFEDDVSVSPGYFNEGEDELTIDDVPFASIDMPIKDKGVFSAMDGEELEDDFSDIKSKYSSEDNYEGGFEDDVSVSPGYFNEGKKTVKVTVNELQKIIKEGVAKLHKKTLIESRIEQINNELNNLSNPQAWKDAREDALSQRAKQTLNWEHITKREQI